MFQSTSLNPQLTRIQRRALIAGAVGMALCVVGVFLDLDQFFQSYLLGFVFWVGVTLGCFVWLTVHFMAGGVWSLALRRLMETGTLLTVLMALLFVPLAFGLDSLYIWTHADHVAESEILRHKQPYLNEPFFLARTAFYFVLWIGLALLIYRWSGQQDRRGDARTTRRLQLTGGPVLLVYGLTITFASVDWIMSLEPEWFSTIFGVLIATGQALTALAFMLLVLALVVDQAPFVTLLRPQHFYHLGNLLLTSVILWSYMAFMQYLIIWSGNIPEEVVWYIHRLEGGWQWVALFLLLFHFVFPFAILLVRGVRLRLDRLIYIAVIVLVANFVHLFWLIAPTFHHEGFYLHWLDLSTPLAIGGLWIGVFFWLLGRRPLLPTHDRVLEGIREHGIEEPPVSTAERRRTLE